MGCTKSRPSDKNLFEMVGYSDLPAMRDALSTYPDLVNIKDKVSKTKCHNNFN